MKTWAAPVPAPRSGRASAGYWRLSVRGLAGAVLALEASRLARNNRDWHHLVDLCALTETLLIDSDGIYDPRQLNDRLVLGLKGTMSEFELGLLRQRAREAFEQKVRRGFALWEVPVGFIRTEEGQLKRHPIARCSRRSSAYFRSFNNWEVRVKRRSGSGKSKSRCPRPNPELPEQEVSLGVAEQRKNPSDAEQPVLCRSVRLWQDRGAHGDRAGASAATLALPETT